MGKKIKIRAGKTTVEMSDDLVVMTNNLVNKLLPDTRRMFEHELNLIKKEATEKWLVRKSSSLSAEQQTERVYQALTKKAGKPPEAAKAIIAAMKKKGSLQGRDSKESRKSKGSKDKTYVELAITPNFELIGIIGNTAEYAWAIRVGEDTQNTGLQKGKRLANELLYKPVRKKTNKLASQLADEIGKKIK